MKISKFYYLILFSLASLTTNTNPAIIHSTINKNLLNNKFLPNITWSILIATVKEREELFYKIYSKIINQIKKNNLSNNIEIIYFQDNLWERPTGEKRNTLISLASGKYINFIDDDDDISNNYIRLIYSNLLKNPDCLSLTGIITYNNKNPRIFLQSVKYKNYFTKQHIAYRPPTHLNAIKKSIASKFKFPEKFINEDVNWALQIAKSNLLKKEIAISDIYYFYKYNNNISVQTTRSQKNQIEYFKLNLKPTKIKLCQK